MDTTKLREEYEDLLAVAAEPRLGEAADGGWNADQILAHLFAVDASVAAVALSVVAGSRPAFDNRSCLDTWNISRIVDTHPDRDALIARVRDQAGILGDIAERLRPDEESVLVPALLLSNDEVAVDQPITVRELIDGLAQSHVPSHAQQLRELRPETSSGD